MVLLAAWKTTILLQHQPCHRRFEQRQLKEQRGLHGARASALISISPMGPPVPVSHEAGKKDCVFIVNPNGANGKTANTWKKLLPKLTARLTQYNICEKLTTGPHHATELAREAIEGGAEAVIAVGGDGTLHEVMNGFFENGKLVEPKQTESSDSAPRPLLGLIPLGTGSDFARFFGWNTDPMQAMERIAKGQTKKIDVGHVTYGKDQKERCFINVADVHLSAKAGFFAGKHKKLGNLCYVVGALQAFQGHKNRDFKIRVDGGDWETLPNVTSICVGNSKYFGGGMKIVPAGDPSSGDLEVVILSEYKWYDFVMKLSKLYNGTHIEQPNVACRRVRTIDVEEIQVDSGADNYLGTYIQADGEHLGFLNASFSALPGVIDFIV